MENKTLQPARVIVGHCPDCGDPIVILNDFEMWPLFYCRCGRVGTTHEIINRMRYENYWQLSDLDSVRVHQRQPGRTPTA